MASHLILAQLIYAGEVKSRAQYPRLEPIATSKVCGQKRVKFAIISSTAAASVPLRVEAVFTVAVGAAYLTRNNPRGPGRQVVHVGPKVGWRRGGQGALAFPLLLDRGHPPGRRRRDALGLLVLGRLLMVMETLEVAGSLGLALLDGRRRRELGRRHPFRVAELRLVAVVVHDGRETAGAAPHGDVAAAGSGTEAASQAPAAHPVEASLVLAVEVVVEGLGGLLDLDAEGAEPEDAPSIRAGLAASGCVLFNEDKYMRTDLRS